MPPEKACKTVPRVENMNAAALHIHPFACCAVVALVICGYLVVRGTIQGTGNITTWLTRKRIELCGWSMLSAGGSRLLGSGQA